eukprot:g28501.t1
MLPEPPAARSCFERCRKRRRVHEAFGASASSTATADLVELPKWVVWVSVDPRSGHITPYPKEVSQTLELALQRGDATVSLGDRFFGATVELGAAPQQRTARGGRDVRRVALKTCDEAVTLWVRQGRYRWGAVDGVDPSNAQGLQEIDTKGLRGQESGLLLIMRKAWRSGSVYSHVLQDCFWGIYNEQQNRQIEEAYQSGERQIEITVGVRQYQVVFGPPGFARQEDPRLRKRRLMRRQWLSPEHFQRRMTQDQPATTARDQEECILCLCDFADTAHMPVVELPECKHVFHRACAQQLVDARGRCPCCRSEVDWSFLG